MEKQAIFFLKGAKCRLYQTNGFFSHMMHQKHYFCEFLFCFFFLVSFLTFAPTRKRDVVRQTPDAGQNPGATKIPLPLRAGDKNPLVSMFCTKNISAL